MFEKFSARSRQVVFAARFKAGERAANTISADDLLVSLILEDQGLLLTKKFLSTIFGEEGEFVHHAPEAPLQIKFLAENVAEDLLNNLNANQTRSEPIPTTAEIPLSTSLESVFNSADLLASRLQHSRIEPLHLFAAILKEGSSDRARLLLRVGITEKNVLSALIGTLRSLPKEDSPLLHQNQPPDGSRPLRRKYVTRLP
jgi:ATP-dependent Clp protease ATP-binding subunit ClpA